MTTEKATVINDLLIENVKNLPSRQSNAEEIIKKQKEREKESTRFWVDFWKIHSGFPTTLGGNNDR